MTSQITSHIKYVIPVGPGTVPKSGLLQICNQQSSYNKNLRAPKTVNTAAAEPLAAPLMRHLVTLYIMCHCDKHTGAETEEEHDGGAKIIICMLADSVVSLVEHAWNRSRIGAGSVSAPSKTSSSRFSRTPANRCVPIHRRRLCQCSECPAVVLGYLCLSLCNTYRRT